MSEEASVSQVTVSPVPIWLVRLPAGTHSRQPFDEYEMFMQLDPELLRMVYRAVSFDRLSHVVANGVDVDPVDSVMWVDHFDKAWEYGGWPKLVMALDPNTLHPSGREVRADEDPMTLSAICEDYPTTLPSKDGSKLWCSRLPESDTRVSSSYERMYGRWAPRGAKPLRAIFVFVRPQEEDAALQALAG